MSSRTSVIMRGPRAKSNWQHATEQFGNTPISDVAVEEALMKDGVAWSWKGVEWRLNSTIAAPLRLRSQLAHQIRA
eukprot:scaffold63172_cov27-Tisochrysis_lutea.AAC.4